MVDLLHRLRLTCKQGAASLGIRPEKWTQGGKTAFLKVAACLLDNPAGAIIELAFAIVEVLIRRDRTEQRRFESELPAREAMLSGRRDPP